MLRSQPRIDMFFLFILAILWLGTSAPPQNPLGTRLTEVHSHGRTHYVRSLPSSTCPTTPSIVNPSLTFRPSPPPAQHVRSCQHSDFIGHVECFALGTGLYSEEGSAEPEPADTLRRKPNDTNEGRRHKYVVVTRAQGRDHNTDRYPFVTLAVSARTYCYELKVSE